MANATRGISVKLTKTEAALVDELVRQQRYDSRSGVIRAGLGAIFDKYPFCRQAEIEIERERSIITPRSNRKLRWSQATTKAPAEKKKTTGRSRGRSGK